MTENKYKKNPVIHALKYSIVDLIVNLTRLAFHWVPGGDIERGHLLMTFHILIIWGTVIIFFILPRRHILKIVLLGFMVLTVISQWLFHGCVFTKAEQILTGNKTSSLDSFIRMCGSEPDNEKRILITLCCGTCIFTIMVVNLIADFIY
jgi:hypothetical protein